MARPRSVLASLIGPLSADRFLAEHWQKKPLLRRGRFAGFSGIPELFSPRALARVYQQPVRTLWREGAANKTAVLPPGEAVALHEAKGGTLYFTDVNDVLPALERWFGRLGRELGLPPAGGQCSLYASSGGSGLPWHFDENDNFVIQLSGRKRWRMAPNPHVRNPVHSVALGQEGPAEFRLYCPEGLPPRISRGVSTFDLEAGSCLYVPRGCWHATAASRAGSLSLSVTLRPLSYGSFVLQAIEQALLAQPGWREAVRGAWGGERDKAAARRRLGELLAGLAGDLSVLTAADLIPRSAAARAARYRRNPLAVVSFRAVPGASVIETRNLANGELSELRVTRACVPLCRWVMRRSVFTAGEAVAAFPRLEAEDLRAVLEGFCSAGLIQPET